MSKAQGDGFRTWTNKGLADYSRRLGEKVSKMADQRTKWYTFGDFAILAETAHIVENPAYGTDYAWGKWNGWEVTGDEYRVAMYDLDDLTDRGDGTYEIKGLPVLHKYVTTKDSKSAKDEANEFFRFCKANALA